MRSHQQPFEVDKNVDFGSGRIETRSCYVKHNLELMENVLAWKGIKSAILIHSKREIRDRITEEFRFYLSSKEGSAAYFNHRIRENWSIENQLHWHLESDRCG